MNLKTLRLSDVVLFNPKETIKKGTLAKKVDMAVLQPFTKDIPSYEISEYKGGAKFRNGDTIMARITPCLENGKTSKVNILSKNEVGFGSTEYIVFRAVDGITDEDFIYYLVCSSAVREPAVKSMVGSSGRQRVQIDVLKNLEITIPDIETQKKISSVLSALDDKIELNNRINKNLEEQAQAIFKSWFVDFEPFGNIMPKNWKKSDIYSISKIIYGVPFKSKLFNSEKNGMPIVRIRDLKSQELKTYTTEKHPKGYLIQNGDIVVGMDGEFKPYIWGNNEAWLNQRVCVFSNSRPKGKMFLYFTIKPLLNIIEKTEVATTVIHIGKQDFDAFEINLPTDDILDKFDNITFPIYQKIVNNKIESKRLSALRDSLLPELMNGKIDVSDVKI